MRTFHRTLLLSCAVAVTGGATADGWKPAGEAWGVTVEERPAADSSFPEFRASAVVEADPTGAADVVWTYRPDSVEARMVEWRKVLSTTPTSRLVEQVVRPPVVAPRHSIVRFTRMSDGDGSIRIRFSSQPIPHPADGAVPVALVRGEWRFVPRGDGKTLVEYRCVADPGGGLPPWMAWGTQRDMAAELVQEVVARTAR